jgi:putative inorganic carbon (HCO3(-)) transporter
MMQRRPGLWSRRREVFGSWWWRVSLAVRIGESFSEDFPVYSEKSAEKNVASWQGLSFSSIQSWTERGFSMKLDLSHSNSKVSFLGSIWVFEFLWVLAALLLFLAGPKQTIWAAAGLALLAISFLQRWVVTGRTSRSTVFDVPWILLLVGAIVSLWVSYDVSLSWPILLILTGSIALYYAVANSPRQVVLARVALLVGLATAVYFLTQYQYIWHADKIPVASFLGSVASGQFARIGLWEPFPNGVATLLEGLLPLGVGLAVADRSRAWRVLSGVATGILGLAVVVTASRGAWVALLVASALWVASRRRWSVVVLGGIAIIALIVLGGYLALVEGATLAGIPVIGPALNQLSARPGHSLRLIQDFPLTGIGMGEVFGQVYSQYVLLIRHVYLTYSHNLYFTIWLGHGMLGAIGLGWLVMAFGRLAVQENQQGHSAPLFQAAWVGVVAILTHGLFDARQYVDLWTMWPLFVLLGLMVSASTVRRKGTIRTRRTTHLRLTRWGALVSLALSAIVVWRPLAAMTWANLGAVKQAKAELGDLHDGAREVYLRAAIADYERALQLDPDNRTANLRLGNLAVAAGRYEEGVEYLEVVWRSAPEDPTACKALGLAYAWVGEIDKAARLLQSIKDIVTELNTWGWWHNHEGRQQVAINAYRTSLALKPDQPQVRDSLTAMENK